MNHRPSGKARHHVKRREIVEMKDDTHTFKRIYFQGQRVILQSVKGAYPPELLSKRRVRRMRKIWGARY